MIFPAAYVNGLLAVIIIAGTSFVEVYLSAALAAVDDAFAPTSFDIGGGLSRYRPQCARGVWRCRPSSSTFTVD